MAKHKQAQLSHLSFTSFSPCSLPLLTMAPVQSKMLEGSSSQPIINHVGTCTLCDETGKRCLCKRYQDPDVITPGTPILCRECGHGLSHHDGHIQGAIAGSSTAVSAIIRSLVSDPKTVRQAREETNANFRHCTSPDDDSQKAYKGKVSSRVAR